MATKMKFAPDEVVEAWQGGVVALDDGSEVTIQAGERRRGGDPVVKRVGDAMFARDGEPAPDTVFGPSIRAAEAAAKEEPPPPPPRIDGSTPLSALFIAKDKVLQSRAGSWESGLIVHENDPRRRGVPEAFKPLLEVL